jgi:hypothetical protein
VHDQFFHVRVIIGVVAGLTMTRLLNGLARFVQHPLRVPIYPVHLGWVVYLLISVMLFWWFEYNLALVERWTFQKYLFVVGYASLYFFTSTLLFPDTMDDYDGFADYFHSRQAWFYGLLAATFLVDLLDSALKGPAHFSSLGPAYLWRQSLLAVLALVAMRVRDRRLHAGFLILALLMQLWVIARYFDVLD